MIIIFEINKACRSNDGRYDMTQMKVKSSMWLCVWCQGGRRLLCGIAACEVERMYNTSERPCVWFPSFFGVAQCGHGRLQFTHAMASLLQRIRGTGWSFLIAEGTTRRVRNRAWWPPPPRHRRRRMWREKIIWENVWEGSFYVDEKCHPGENV